MPPLHVMNDEGGKRSLGYKHGECFWALGLGVDSGCSEC